MFNFKLRKQKSASQFSGNSSQNPKVLEVNLIKNEIPVDFELRKNLGTLFFSLGVTALFVAEIYFGLNWWADYEKARVSSAEEKFNKVSQEIKKLKDDSDRILAFKKRVDAADALLTDHIYWTNFFNWLEKNTLSSVNYLSFSGKSDGVYELQATTRSFREISWQVRALLEDPAVISARVNNGGKERTIDSEKDKASADNVNFTLSLKIDPALFKSSAK